MNTNIYLKFKAKFRINSKTFLIKMKSKPRLLLLFNVVLHLLENTVR